MECATIFYDKEHYFPMHLHPDRYTFSYILNGSANLICNNTIYILKPGDLVVIPPFVAHQTLIEDHFHYRVIRVPKRHSFLSVNHSQLGLTILKNNSFYNVQYNQWFDLIKTNVHEKVKIPTIFEPYLTNQTFDKSRSKVLLKKALIHLESNFNRPIPVEELSDVTHLSESHFQRLFKANVGISPMRYLQNLRIEKAKEYIKTRNGFTEIAYDTGFFDQSHFNKYFKINVGMIPKRYADLVKND